MDKTFEHQGTTRQDAYKGKQFSKELQNQIYGEISKLKTKWTDDLFPPDQSSLYSGKTDFSGYKAPEVPKFLSGDAKGKFASQYALQNKNSKYVWKRLSEVYRPGEINILKEPVEIKDDPDIITEDVVQGELGDCYFLSAISALAEMPKRIKSLIPNQNIASSGVFEVTVFIHGEPTKIVVDDHFPMIHTEDEGEPSKLAFVGINQRSKNIWPLILEKAWAKVNLNYEDIIAGNSGEAFEFLSPAPIDTFYHDVHKDCLFEEIKEADDKDYIICTDITASENTNIDYLAKMGLITNHAYAIIDVAELTDPKGNKIRLLKIRNPWGSNEWTGDWSDKSKKWTPEYKKLLNFNDEDDGTFWMAYEDFVQFYTCTHVCKIHDDYSFISSKFIFDKNHPFNLVSVNVPKDTSGFFLVNQKNVRIYRFAKGLTDFENKYCSMIVFRKEGDKMVYIGASCGRDNRLYVECNEIKKGTYYIAVSFPSKGHAHINEIEELHKKHLSDLSDNHLTYRIGVYTAEPKLQIVEVQDKDRHLTASFLKDVINNLAAQNPNIYYFAEEGEKTSWRSISFEKEAGAYGYIVYQNNSDGFIHEHLTLTQFQNINLIPLLDNGDLADLDVESEDVIEDPHERTAIEVLKSRSELKSAITITNVVPCDEEVTERNPIELTVKVAPRSSCMILVEKVDEDAGIELSSNIAITYPTHSILDEKRFPSKKTRVKYNNKFVEIYECVIEHNSGVVFKYKNKTKDLKFAAHIIFPELENLTLSLKPEAFREKEDGDNNDNKISKKEMDAYASYDPSTQEFDIKDHKKEIVVSLEPGETKFFELAATDVFESFSYSCTMDYHINLARTQIKQQYGMK